MNLQSITELDLESDLINSPLVIDETDDEIGTVSDVLVEESGRFRYLVIQGGDWLSNRLFLVPVGLCRSYNESQAIALVGFKDKQYLAEIPSYESNGEIDYDYEESLRQMYRQLLDKGRSNTTYARDSYSYDDEPELYEISAQESQTIKLYEEKLVTSKERHEVSEVTIGKKVETEIQEVEIPVEKEKVVVKTTEVADEKIPVEPGEAMFEEGTVAKVKVYEEKANVDVEAFVREEVEVKKEVEKEIAEFKETVRKEELEMTGEENIEIEK